jgi:MraZ protein
VFRGSSNLTLDVKGRLIIPARHRDTLIAGCDGHVVITIDSTEQCLLIYPKPVWEPIEQDLDNAPNLNLRVREMQRRLIGFAVDTDMDAAGRLLIAPELRKYARLQKDVVLVGQGKKFELWDQQLWETYITAPSGYDQDGSPPQLGDLSL